jgi:hypothetical protein
MLEKAQALLSSPCSCQIASTWSINKGLCAFARLPRVLGFPAKMNGSQRSREMSQQVLVFFTIDVVNHISSFHGSPFDANFVTYHLQYLRIAIKDEWTGFEGSSQVHTINDSISIYHAWINKEAKGSSTK